MIYEILTIVFSSFFVSIVFGTEIYKLIKKKPVGDCQYCHSSYKKLIKKYHKIYSKNNQK